MAIKIVGLIAGILVAIFILFKVLPGVVGSGYHRLGHSGDRLASIQAYEDQLGIT